MRNLLLPLTLLLTLFASAQHSWVKRYNGPASKQDGARTMVVKNGFVYVAGFSEGKKGNQDYAVVKYSVAGAEVWVARYNGTGNSADRPYSLAVDNNGNVYVTGGSIGANGTYDYATVKYNSNGGQEWVKRYEGVRHDIAKDVEVDEQGNVYVTGFADGASQFSGNVIYTVKYGPGGAEKWNAIVNLRNDTYDGSAINMEEGTSLAVDGAGNIFITGASGGMVTLKYPIIDDTHYGTPWIKPGSIASGHGREVLIDGSGNVVVTGFSSETIKYSPDGNVIWTNVYHPGPGQPASFWDMAMDEAGNVYVSGMLATGTGGDDYLTVKYNSTDGSKAWEKLFGGSMNGSDMAQSVAYSSNPNGEFVYVTGRCYNRVGRTGTAQIGTIKYNTATGEQEDALFYDGPDKQGSGGFEVATDADGAIYVSGETVFKTSYYDFTTLKYEPAAAITSLSNSSVVGEKIAPRRTRLTGYPNPVSTSGMVEFELVKPGQARVTLIDNLGKEVKVLSNDKRSAGLHRISFDRWGLAGGTYYVRLQSDAGNLVKEVVIAR